MLETSKHLIKQHRDHTNEYDTLLRVAQLMRMSTSNIPEPDFHHDIKNIEQLLFDLTNQLLITKLTRHYPSIRPHTHNKAWFTVQLTQDSNDCIHIQKHQLQFIWETYRHCHTNTTHTFLENIKTTTIQLKMEQPTYTEQGFIPRNITSFAMKYLKIDTEHFTNSFHANRLTRYLTNGTPEHHTKQQTWAFSVQWDTNSIGLYMRPRDANQALSFAILSQFHPTSQRPSPSHILFIPTETYKQIPTLDTMVQVLRIFPPGQLKLEPTHSKVVYGQNNTLADKYCDEHMSMIAISKDKQWLQHTKDKLPHIDEIFERFSGHRPKEAKNRQCETMGEITHYDHIIQQYPEYMELARISTTQKCFWDKDTDLTSIFLTSNLRELGIHNPSLMVAGLNQISNSPLDEEPFKRFISQSTVDDMKRIFGNFVISELDKNNGASLICCPVYYYQHLKASYTLDPHYAQIRMSKHEIFQKWKDEWELISPKHKKKNRLKTPLWQGADIPSSYILFKNKDICRIRPITSYFKHPFRSILGMAHAGMTFIMKQVNAKTRGHFSLNIGKPENLVPLIQKINSIIRENKKDKIKIELYMGDIKQMYTELLHSEIKKSVDWILDLYNRRYGNAIKIRKRLRKDITMRDLNVVRGNSWVTSSNYMTVTLEQLKQIIIFDMENTFFKVGTKIYLQIKGIPMGSNISPVLAYLICEYYEREIPLRIPEKRLRHLFGARYMDDLLLIFFYAEHDGILRDMLTEDVKMITDTSRENPIYHKDLNIKPETDPRGAPCLGTLITKCTDPDTGSQTLNIRPLNKNEITT